MTSPDQLLRDLSRSAPYQPATNLWRAVELDAVQRHGLGPGLGLDLGCGDGKLTGVLMDALGDAGGRITWVGVDVDPEETALARSTGRYLRVHTGSAAAIPEPDATFDFVFSNSVLEHIGPIDEVLAEAARLLKPGGRFVATVPGPEFHACLAGPLRPWADRRAYEADVDRRCAHLRYWDEPTWREHLGRCGLRMTGVTPYLSRRQTRRWERLSNLTGGLAWSLFGRGRRPIEVQRAFRMRTDRPTVTGRLAAATAGLVAVDCPLDASDQDGAHACLLVDAVKG